MVYQVVAGKTVAEQEGHIAEYLLPVDGNIAAVTQVDETPGEGRQIRPGSFDLGRAVKPDHVPTIYKREGGGGYPLSDFHTSAGKGFLVSDHFKRIVQDLEPQVHQFFPVTVKSGGKVVGQLFQFVVCNRIDGLDHVACVPPIKPGDRLYSPTYGPADKRVFNTTKIGPVHIWAEMRELGIWMSDTLRNAIFSTGLTGIKDTDRYDETT